MKKWNLLLVPVLVLGLAISFTGCSKDEDNGTTPTVLTISDTLVGTWISAGANVAIALTLDPSNIDSLVVTFNEDNTISTYSHKTTGDESTWTGVWTVDEESGVDGIYTIVVDYTVGYVHTEEGVFQITAENDGMTLELVQTVPYLGFTVPTPADGFGSTVYGSYITQVYVRQ
jgi:hypothetical protein